MKQFYFDFMGSFKGNAYISTQKGGEATGEFFKLFFAPFYLTFILGFATLAANGKWDGILLNAIQEFMQMTGIKLSFYIVIGVAAFSFIFYGVEKLTSILSWIVKSLSHSAFAMCAVMTGVLWGIVIPAIVDTGDLAPLYSTLSLSIFTIGLAIAFYFSSKLFCSTIRSEIDNTFGKHTRVFTFLIGLGFMAIFINTVFFEEAWLEVPKETSVANAP